MMAESQLHLLSAQPDMNEMCLEAQHRWLSPSEIHEILQNYKKISITSKPPNRPPSGSLLLFDRHMLRHFRRDGHNWRKNKDSKKVKEAHEKLKVGGVDVLNCYYAYGEENEKFQRRSYWLLKQELSHLVLVHYLEVKGKMKSSIRIKKADGVAASWQNGEDICNSQVDMDSSAASEFQSLDSQRTSPLRDTTKLNSTQASEHEDARGEKSYVVSITMIVSVNSFE